MKYLCQIQSNKKNKCNPSVNYIKNRALNIRRYTITNILDPITTDDRSICSQEYAIIESLIVFIYCGR